MASKARNDLNLQHRVEVIEYKRKNQGVGSRKLSELFGCGQTQIQAILRNKKAILEEYDTNAPATRKCHRGSSLDDLNEATYVQMVLPG